MKKILLLVVSVMLCGAVVFASPKSHAEMSKKGNKVSANFSTVGGGGKLDKLFAEAMKSGRSNRKTKTGMGDYQVTTSKFPKVPIPNVWAYAKSHNYIVTSIRGRRVTKFGFHQEVLQSVNFIPDYELGDFIAEMPVNGCKTGTVRLMYPNLFRSATIKWTGNVNGTGNIEGNGHGWCLINNKYYLVQGEFKNGVLSGEGTFTELTPVLQYYQGCQFLENVNKVTHTMHVGDFSNGIASIRFNKDKYGFVNGNGELVAPAKYTRVVQKYNGEYAVVIDPSNNNYEVKIDGKGKYMGLSDNQLAINERNRLAKIAEEKRQAEEKRIAEENKRKQREEQERAAREAEQKRVARIRELQPGDKIYYSQEWHWEEGFWIFKEGGRYTMTVTCFVEQNINNGERLQIRVGDVSSSDEDRYKTPVIDGIEYRKGDVVWIKPLTNGKWQPSLW